ncbi:Protein CBG00838 [Caenorhabditis briggsae]|uniref:Protein CBG00838 n=1 Tax=Caenorhabditis briggsae TaxID=6238 RepID=A8WNY8_CAEBR|nr:Protein CBG00838 [Caenorhabditis briggsae]CAP22194.2 Protein CBG00838 [Caenorhabditis briggsae]
MKILSLLPLVVFVVEAGGYSRKVINGEYVKKGEHPWAVSVYVRYYNKKNQFKTLLGPGTMISSRHIVAFNSLFRSTENLNLLGMEDTGIKGICEGDNLILPQELLPRYDADLEYLNDMNGNREFRNTIAKATVINGCKKLLPSNPMILELIAPLENSTVPVCISNSARNWERVGGFSVYGMDRPGRLVSGRFRPIECSASAPFSCAEASNKSSQGLCQGNFGGSAIAKMGHRHVMLGFYAGGNSACKANTETIPPFKFVNLGHYRQESARPLESVCHHLKRTSLQDHKQKPHQLQLLQKKKAPQLLRRVRFTDSHVPHQDLFTFKPPTVPSVAEEEINAETFAPLMISNSSLGDDVIKAETFAPMKIGGGAEAIKTEKLAAMRIGGDGEVIKAETFEPMEIDHRGSTRADRIRDIHIHIHLNK